MAILRVKHGPNKGKVYELAGDAPLTLGREPGKGIVIPDQGVSRQHAEVVKIGEVFFIRDLESRNGTFVNEESVREEILRYGDRVRIGNSVLVFEDRLAHLTDSSRILRGADTPVAVSPSSTIQFRLTDTMGGLAPVPPDSVDTPEKRDLNVLFHIAHIIGEEKDLSKLQNQVAKILGKTLKADHVYVLWKGGSGEVHGEFDVIGRYDRDDDASSEAGVSRGIIGDCMRQGRAILTADAAIDAQFQAMESVVVNQLHSVLCVPITALGECRGVVYCYSNKPEAFSPEDLELASVIGIQLGSTISMLKLVSNSDRFFRQTIHTLVSAGEMRTPETRGYCERVATSCLAIAKELGYGTHDLRNAWLVGMLHTIGNIPMTDSEQQQELTRETKRNHYARELLGRVTELAEILPAIECANEHFDGSGSPEGKKGEEIPQLGRILNPAIDLDRVLYGVREGSSELSIKDALLEIRDGAGTKYDPEVIRAMLIAYRKGRLFNPQEQFFEVPF